MTEAKEILFEEEARDPIVKGIKQLADVVSFTLGPKGRNVALEKWGTPEVTNDANKVISAITLPDAFENMGVSMAKEAAQKIKEKCGDGTTTTTILLNALVEEGVKHISAGASPIQLKRGMEKVVDAIVKALAAMATPVEGNKDTENIATASASGNRSIGRCIAEAFSKVGKNGVVTIEEAKGVETSIEVVEGMRFDRGYLSPYFCTDNDRMTVELNNPLILLVEKKISNVHDLLPILQIIAGGGKELLIIAEDIEADVLSTLVVNKLRKILKIAAVKAPGFGDNRKANLEDIAALTGAIVITEEAGFSLKTANEDVLGSAEKIILTKEHTTIVRGGGSKEAIKARLAQIDHQLQESKDNFDHKRLEERKAKLAGGVAVIHVGAATEPELKERKQQFEDSLSSTKAALEKGILPGGGVALLRVSEELNLSLEHDEALSIGIVRKACRAPMRHIVDNAGHDGSLVIAEVAHSNNRSLGFNVESEKVEDLIKAGVIDPLKVVENCLIFAASVAGTVWMTNALISTAKNKAEDDE